MRIQGLVMPRWVVAVLLALGMAACVAGCASSGDSDMPWNQPQPWEGAPSIPGFSGDR